ncbi:YHS domain-containing protein [Thermodesulfobacteriota bacterium]
MVRLIIFVLLAYFAYRLFKGLFKIGPGVSGQSNSGNVVSEMVQDPFCKTYIPRHEAFRIVMDGKEYFFCSEECAEKFKQKTK